LRALAIVESDQMSKIAGFKSPTDSSARIELSEYGLDKLVYKSSSSSDQLAVFSDLYYDKGWKAFVDGKQVDYFRANYLLRAMIVPAGEHEISFRFEPESYILGEKVSLASSIVLLLLIALAIFDKIRKKQPPTVA